MTKLAIKGHPSRGKEIIEILEMLGGKNTHDYICNMPDFAYSINEQGIIEWFISHPNSIYTIFTLEEFLERFPYKVGDRVKTIYGKIGIVSKPIWSNRDNCIRYELEADIDSFYFINELQPYKEETMESKPDLLQQLKEYFDNTPRDILEKEWNELSYLNEIGPSVNEYLECVKKYRQLNQYPKTYEECCKVLNLTKYPPALVPNKATYINQYKDFPCYYEIQKLAELIVCRNAYWKIAGDQMGLGKPWEPDSKNIVHYIYYSMYDNEIQVSCGNLFDNEILTFPTAEMRDTFYKNFKSSIEDCKELL